MNVTNINGYYVELEQTHDGFVTGLVRLGNYCSSIEWMNQVGYLEGQTEDDCLQVPARVRSAIHSWAVANGY